MYSLKKSIKKFLKRFKKNRPINVNHFNLNDDYILDFSLSAANNNLSTVSAGGSVFITSDFDPSVDDETEGRSAKIVKIPVKPIDVLDQLEIEPTPLSLMGIDQKITMLRMKLNMISQQYSKRDVQVVIERLENRKQYPKYKKYFDQWNRTNDEKINSLLEKYDLVMKSADLFIPEFPDIAIKRMKEYSDYCMKICKKKPIFYVIATSSSFADKYKKRDPILLVQSPFGFYYDILGAWDTEMLYLPEL